MKQRALRHTIHNLKKKYNNANHAKDNYNADENEQNGIEEEYNEE